MRNSHVWAMVATAAGLVLAASSASAQEAGRSAAAWSWRDR